MKILRNPVIAVVLAAVLVAGSTAVNVSKKLEKACDKAEAAFFTVEDGRAPAYYVDQCISNAAALTTVAGHYDSAELSAAAAEMKAARSELSDAYADKDISDIYAGMQRLHSALDMYESAASAVSFTEADGDTYADLLTDLDGAYRTVEKSDYNSSVQSFLDKTYNAFPARFFAGLLDVDAPELYAPEVD